MQLGFLAGGYSETCLQLFTCIPTILKQILTTRLDLKGDLLDGMLRFNASAVVTDYDDLQRNQVFEFIDPVSGVPGQETITLNAGESNVNGVEMEATWLASDNLTIRASLGYLDASYDVFDFEGVSLTGLDIPFAAEVQMAFKRPIYIHWLVVLP